jgi:heme-degrading monooxygenase HmoA
MIYEIAEIQVKPDTNAAFEAAVREAIPLFKRAKGCEAMRLERCIERPDTYHLVVNWTTLENHTVDFRGSEDFQTWRALASGFPSPPVKFAPHQRVDRGGAVAAAVGAGEQVVATANRHAAQGAFGAELSISMAPSSQ